VVLAVMLGGMPLTLGIVLHRFEATLTLDVCHPAQSFSHSSTPMVAIIPAPPCAARLLPEYGHYPTAAQALHVRAADTPDPPPPKTRA
jgi:hypothetical protein